MQCLIAIDGSPESSSAIETAAGLAWPADAHIEVLTVVPVEGEAFAGPWVAGGYLPTEAVLDHLRDVAMQTLEEGAARLRRPGLDVVETFAQGRAASVIVEVARELGADLIILGARGHGTIERAVLGSVSSEVVDLAPCAVLVARRGSAARLLLATDGSEDSMSAVAFVEGSGLFAGAETRVIEAVDVHPEWWLGFTPADASLAPGSFIDVMDDAKRYARGVADGVAANLRACGFVAEALVMEGPAARTIVDAAAAWPADLVVIGTRGHGLVKRMLLGSTARSVLHHADASVLITRRTRVVAHDRRAAEPESTPVGSHP